MPNNTDTQSPISAQPPASLYIHIPWCVRKCPYCDFNSHAIKGELPEREYIDALLLDLQQDLHRLQERTISTVFIGGGTPSLFSPESIERLLSGLHTLAKVDPAAEITMEANPGSVEHGKFAEFYAAGINRLSLGIQSFNDDQLGKLGRIHDRKQAIKAVERTHDAGFENFNLDLMFGLPGQHIKESLSDLHTAIDLEPSHLSWYQLTIEPNTAFHHQPPALPDDERIWAIQTSGNELLLAHGFQQYEISAFARPGRQCQHNLNYWNFGDYLGIGAGAHGKITDNSCSQVIRTWKQRHPGQYLQHAATAKRIAGTSTIIGSNLVTEFMMNALRLIDGFPAELFESRTFQPVTALQKQLELAQERDLLSLSDGTIRPTALGIRFLNELITLFME